MTTLTRTGYKMKLSIMISRKPILNRTTITAILVIMLLPLHNALELGLLRSAHAQTDIKIKQMIFDDDWQNDWIESSVKCEINPKYDQWIHNGQYGLGATIEKGGALVFKHSVAVDIKSYNLQEAIESMKAEKSA